MIEPTIIISMLGSLNWNRLVPGQLGIQFDLIRAGVRFGLAGRAGDDRQQRAERLANNAGEPPRPDWRRSH